MKTYLNLTEQNYISLYNLIRNNNYKHILRKINFSEKDLKFFIDIDCFLELKNEIIKNKYSSLNFLLATEIKEQLNLSINKDELSLQNDNGYEKNFDDISKYLNDAFINININKFSSTEIINKIKNLKDINKKNNGLNLLMIAFIGNLNKNVSLEIIDYLINHVDFEYDYNGKFIINFAINSENYNLPFESWENILKKTPTAYFNNFENIKFFLNNKKIIDVINKDSNVLKIITDKIATLDFELKISFLSEVIKLSRKLSVNKSVCNCIFDVFMKSYKNDNDFFSFFNFIINNKDGVKFFDNNNLFLLIKKINLNLVHDINLKNIISLLQEKKSFNGYSKNFIVSTLKNAKTIKLDECFLNSPKLIDFLLCNKIQSIFDFNNEEVLKKILLLKNDLSDDSLCNLVLLSNICDYSKFSYLNRNNIRIAHTFLEKDIENFNLLGEEIKGVLLLDKENCLKTLSNHINDSKIGNVLNILNLKKNNSQKIINQLIIQKNNAKLSIEGLKNLSYDNLNEFERNKVIEVINIVLNIDDEKLNSLSIMENMTLKVLIEKNFYNLVENFNIISKKLSIENENDAMVIYKFNVAIEKIKEKLEVMLENKKRFVFGC